MRLPELKKEPFSQISHLQLSLAHLLSLAAMLVSSCVSWYVLRWLFSLRAITWQALSFSPFHMQNPWRKVVHGVSFFLFFQITRATFKFSATFALHESFQRVGLEPNLPSQAHMGLGEIFCAGGESGWQGVDSSQGFTQNREKEPLDTFNTLRYFK